MFKHKENSETIAEVIIVAKRLLIFLLSSFVLVSCRTGDSVIIATSTIKPIPTILPAATSTVTLTTTPIILPDAMSYQCFDIADHPQADHVLKGTIVYNNSDNTDAILSNNDTKKVYQFPRGKGDRLLEFNVSPDRKHIIYRHSSESNSKAVVATADGKTIWSLIAGPTDPFAWNWFDNEHLIGLVVPKNGMPSLFLLNPFTGQRQELRFDYPASRLFTNDPSDHWSFGRGGLPIYDPTLTRVIYPECNSQCLDKLLQGEGGWPIALWDIETNQVIARILTTDSYGDTPVWTPDGEQFIVAANVDPKQRNFFASEFFAMSREGQLRQLTHLTDNYKETDIPDNYSLSPDGRFVAFWIVDKPNQYKDARLAILNIETSEVMDYCIQSNYFIEPVWSPDGTQLLVVTQGSHDQGVQQIVLVDLVHNYAAQIGDAENTQPVGWMVSP